MATAEKICKNCHSKTSVREEMECCWMWFQQWSDDQRKTFFKKLAPRVTPHKLFALTERMSLSSTPADARLKASECRTFEDQIVFFHLCLNQWTADEANAFVNGLEEIDYLSVMFLYDLIAESVNQV